MLGVPCIVSNCVPRKNYALNTESATSEELSLKMDTSVSMKSWRFVPSSGQMSSRLNKNTHRNFESLEGHVYERLCL